jgi:hypothetical protein
MIVNLKVSDFKGIEKAEVKCDKITFFIGDNRQGKTSMLKSIAWCLIGGNKPFYVKNGKNETRVVADTEKATFDRVLVRGSKKDRIIVTKKQDGSVVDSSIALSNFSEFCFDPINFIFLDPKLQSKVIREALASKMILTDKEAEDLGVVLYEQDGSRVTKDARTLCEDTYKKYYSDRTEINRQIDVIKQKMSSAKLDFIPDQAFIERLELQTSELNSRLNEQIKKNARINAAKGNLVTQQKLQDQLNTLEAEILVAEESMKDKDGQAEENIAALKQNFIKLSAQESELRGSYNTLKKTLDALETGPYPVCPISLKIACNTDMTSVKESMKTELHDMGESLKTFHNQNLALSEQIDGITKLIEIKKTITTKRVERDRTKAMIDNLNISDEALENDEATKIELEQKQKELSTAKMAKELAALGDIEEKVKRQRQLDDLVKKLRNFIDVELTKRAKLEINGIDVKDDGIYFNDVPLSEESTSTQLRAACAIMKNLYPKSRLLLTDRLEILDKKVLEQFVKSYSDNVNGIQLFGTLVEHHTDQYDYLKSIPGVKLIRMKLGVPTEV